MLLNNYWTWKRYVEITDYAYTKLVLTNVFKARNGSLVNMAINTDTNGSTYTRRPVINRILCQNMYIAIGTGTNQPTEEDYNLSEEIIFSSLVYTKNEYINDNGVLIKEFGISGFNGTGQDKLITEAILYKDIFASIDNDTTNPVAFVHEVFQTPILIEANKNFMINLEWTEQ